MTYIIAAIVFALAVAGMAIGVILSNRRIQGSCGGLANLRDRDGNPYCESCTNPATDCEDIRKQVGPGARETRDLSNATSERS